MFRKAYSAEQLLSIVPVPLPTDPLLTSFATVMSELNVWGQTAVMIQKLEQYANHCRAQSIGCMATAESIDKIALTLKSRRDDLMKAVKKLKELDASVGIKRETVRSLQYEIQHLEKDDTVKAAATAISKAKSTSPGLSLNLFDGSPAPKQPAPSTSPKEDPIDEKYLPSASASSDEEDEDEETEKMAVDDVVRGSQPKDE